MNGEELMCEHEPSNRRDRYVVAVIKDDDIIGHFFLVSAKRWEY